MPNADLAILLLIAGGMAMYAASWVLLIRGYRRGGLTAMGVGWLVNAGLVALNAGITGEPPFGNMYQVQVLLSLCFPPLYLVLAWRYGMKWTAPYFAFVSALPLIGTLFMERNALWERMPALQSPWFVPHVLSYMISYALAAVAMSVTAVGWARNRSAREPHPEAAAQILRLALPFMTFGLLSGALWAEQAWGVYWSWDPKETWSLITWTLYILFLHCRRDSGLKRYADLVQLAAFLALLTTFLLVNLLPRMASALHSYA